MKTTTFLKVALVTIVCTLTACKSQKETAVKAEPEIANKYWKLVELNGAAVESTAHIIFRTDGAVNGNLGCNEFNGVYMQQEGNRIKFDKLVNTQKMCLDMSVEDELKRVLQIADNYNLTEKQLVLNKARMVPLARFEAVYMN
ncbi:MAG: META domain-containing protein [Paludibacter sp.]|nr:META domain-containing protein [Paludibacter sp.]